MSFDRSVDRFRATTQRRSRVLGAIVNALIVLLAVLRHSVLALVPRGIRGPDQPWRGTGIRLVVHTPSTDSRGRTLAVVFGPGAGYIGGATFYIGLRCRVQRNYSYQKRRVALVLTNNGNRCPSPGYY